MMRLTTLLSAAGLALLAMPAFAQGYASGAITSTMVDNKEVLTDANGMTLYTYDKDMVGVSNCYDECATNWPPLPATAGAEADGYFTVVDRTDGTKMWAYKGRPLYLWGKDTKAGDMTGEGVGGTWHVAFVTPDV